MPQDFHRIGAQLLGSPQDSRKGTQTTGETPLFLFGAYDILRGKRFHPAQHFRIKCQGFLLGIKMRKVRGCDDECISILQGFGKGISKSV